MHAGAIRASCRAAAAHRGSARLQLRAHGRQPRGLRCAYTAKALKRC